MKLYFNQVAPFLNLKTKCAIKNKNMNSIGINAGYIKKLSDKFPFIKAIIERCIPQPKQSIPKYLLYGQDNILFSSRLTKLI
tara:strand:- start:677 stop:922 length:246 start_codon:yes stop_codon:yes gene_type:complete